MSSHAPDSTDPGTTPPAALEGEEISALFPILVEQSLVGIYLVQDGRFAYANPKLADIFGYTQDEILALPSILDLVDERDRDRVRENLRRRIDGEVEDVRHTFHGRRRDGSVLIAEARGTRTEFADRPAVIGTLLDVSERVRAEQELRESEERFRFIVEGGREVFFYIHDREGRFEYLSPSVREVVGYDAEELRGRSYEEILADPQPDDVRRLTEQALLDGERQPPYTAVVRHRDGALRTLEIVETPIIQSDGVVGMRGFARDITARVETERERDRLYEEARDAVQARDEMLAVVSHDLRNPLNSIRMSVTLLMEEVDRRASVKRALEVADKAVRQMDRLIEDLLDVSRLEAGVMTLRCSELNPADCLVRACHLVERVAERKSIELERDLQEGVPAVHADAERLLQVLTNLLSNAIEFTPEGGRITVGAEPADDEVRIAVSDTGDGIPSEDIPYLFDRFWQRDTGARRGAGLGLAISKGIVEAHGGRIWAESTVGEGSVFLFTLPRADAG